MYSKACWVVLYIKYIVTKWKVKASLCLYFTLFLLSICKGSLFLILVCLDKLEVLLYDIPKTYVQSIAIMEQGGLWIREHVYHLFRSQAIHRLERGPLALRFSHVKGIFYSVCCFCPVLLHHLQKCKSHSTEYFWEHWSYQSLFHTAYDTVHDNNDVLEVVSQDRKEGIWEGPYLPCQNAAWHWKFNCSTLISTCCYSLHLKPFTLHSFNSSFYPWLTCAYIFVYLRFYWKQYPHSGLFKVVFTQHISILSCQWLYLSLCPTACPSLVLYKIPWDLTKLVAWRGCKLQRLEETCTYGCIGKCQFLKGLWRAEKDALIY